MKAIPDGKGGFRVDSETEKEIEALIGKEARGAIPNGSRIMKRNSDKGDRTPNGVTGTVIGSMGPHPVFMGPHFILHGYLIRWDNDQDHVGFVIDSKVKLC